MNRRTSTYIYCAGAVILAGSILGKFVGMPELAELPADFTGTGVLTGSIQTHIDPNNVAQPKPVDVERTVSVIAVKGNRAIITMKSKTYPHPRVDGAAPSLTDSHTYAIDRRTMRQVAPFGYTRVEDQQGGVTFALPPGEEGGDQTLYDTYTRSAQPLNYQGPVTFHGRSGLRNVVDATGEIADEGLRGKLQALVSFRFQGDGNTVPKAALVALGVPAEKLDSLPEALRVDYRVHNRTELISDKRFGVIMNIDTVQSTSISIEDAAELGLGEIPLTVTKVSSSDAAVTTTLERLNDSERKLLLADIALGIAAALGAGLILFGIAGSRREPK
ncbi:porin PorA family protein [Nocardia sp. NPDC050712]|uniref:porin PorA family protein n=1 Tax=Nocardia sp. NPDC050712 TaxID=3155518 RepID=UPI003409CF17